MRDEGMSALFTTTEGKEAMSESIADHDAATIAATVGALEYAAGLAYAHDNEELASQLYDAARNARWFERNGDSGCCPVCEEVDCDEGCPMEPIRSRLAAVQHP